MRYIICIFIGFSNMFSYAKENDTTTNHCLMFRRTLKDSIVMKYFCIDTLRTNQIEMRRGGFFKDCSDNVYKKCFIKYLPEPSVAALEDSFHFNEDYLHDSSLQIGAYISDNYYTITLYRYCPIGKRMDIYYKRKGKSWVFYKREYGEM